MATIWIYNPGSTPVKISTSGHSVGGKNFASCDDSDPVLIRALNARRVVLTMEPQPPPAPGWVTAAERRSDPESGTVATEPDGPTEPPKKAQAKRKKAAPRTKAVSSEQDTNE